MPAPKAPTSRYSRMEGGNSQEASKVQSHDVETEAARPDPQMIFDDLQFSSSKIRAPSD